MPSFKNLALDLIDTDERREQAAQLFQEFLPHLAAEVENNLHEQEAKVSYEFFIHKHHPKIKVTLKLKKLEHEYLIHLDSKAAMFVIGSEFGGAHAANAMNASSVLRTMLMKFKVN